MKALIISLFMSATVLLAALPAHSEKWAGVDEAVVEKVAKEHGRKAREPLVNMEGDIGLFVFLIAGAVGGFAGGYFFRTLVDHKKTTHE